MKESFETLLRSEMVQGKDVFYPQTLFILILDRVMKRVKGSTKGGLPWGMKESWEIWTMRMIAVC